MLFSKNSFICTKDAPILSSHRCLQALTRSSTVDSAVPRPSVPLFLSGVYPATSTWLLQLPLRSPRSTKGSREHVYFLIRTLPFNNTTLLLGCISLCLLPQSNWVFKLHLSGAKICLPTIWIPLRKTSWPHHGHGQSLIQMTLFASLSQGLWGLWGPRHLHNAFWD